MTSVPDSNRRLIAYWLTTLFVTVTSAVAGPMDVFHVEPLFSLSLHLGYPPYFSTMLGVWKVLGVLALLVPGFPRLKEWAYAGFFIEYTAAVTSHTALRDDPTTLIGPILSIACLVASWALRPPTRRLAAT